MLLTEHVAKHNPFSPRTSLNELNNLLTKPEDLEPDLKFLKQRDSIKRKSSAKSVKGSFKLRSKSSTRSHKESDNNTINKDTRSNQRSTSASKESKGSESWKTAKMIRANMSLDNFEV